MNVELGKVSVNFDLICYPFRFEQKIWISVTLRRKPNINMQYPKKQC